MHDIQNKIRAVQEMPTKGGVVAHHMLPCSYIERVGCRGHVHNITRSSKVKSMELCHAR